MNKKLVVAIALIGVVLLSFLFLNKKESTLNESTASINVGVILPLTGPVAEPGKGILKGIELAVQENNKLSETDATKKKINLIIEDSKSSPKEGVAAFNKLKDINKVQFVIGDLMSSVFLATAPIAEENRIVHISPGASSPDVAQAGDYNFRTYLSDDIDAQVMSAYIAEQNPTASIALLTVNNDYGVGLKKRFAEEVKNTANKITVNEQYNQGETNFKALVTKLRSKSFDTIYMVCNPPECGLLVNELSKQKISAILYGNIGFDSKEFINIAKGNFKEVIFTSPSFDMSSKSDEVEKFKELYASLNQGEPDFLAAQGFDTANILIRALNSSELSSEAVKAALYKTQGFKGVTGEFSFDENGDVMKDVSIKIVSSDGVVSKIK